MNILIEEMDTFTGRWEVTCEFDNIEEVLPRNDGVSTVIIRLVRK